MNKTILSLLLTVLLIVPTVSALQVTVNDYDPKPAEAGDYLNVWLKIENSGSERVTNAQIEVIPKDGFSLAAGEDAKKTIGTLDTYDYTIIHYRLLISSDAVEGLNYLEVKIYDDGLESSYDVAFTIQENNLNDVELEIADVSSQPTRLRAGDDSVDLTVNVHNLGDATARAVKATLQKLPQGITFSESYSDRELLGNIGEEEGADATFYVDIEDSVLSGEYEAELLLSYKYKPDEDEDDYVIEEITLPIIISIKASPQYAITKAVLNQPFLRAGDEDVELTLTITNIGEEEGESVRVKIYDKTEQPISFSQNNNFVASQLKPGETAQTTLVFDVDEEAALQSYLLDVEIKNVVDDEVLVYRETLPLTVDEEQQQGVGRFIVAAIILVLILFVLFRRTQKNKRK